MHMLMRKKLYLKIEYHWYCIGRLKKKLKNAKGDKKRSLWGKIEFHKFMAEQASIKYEILIGIRDRNGNFTWCLSKDRHFYFWDYCGIVLVVKNERLKNEIHKFFDKTCLKCL